MRDVSDDVMDSVPEDEGVMQEMDRKLSLPCERYGNGTRCWNTNYHWQRVLNLQLNTHTIESMFAKNCFIC